MLSLRSTTAAAVALFLLTVGLAQAATLPTASKASRPLAHRAPLARPAAKAPARLAHPLQAATLVALVQPGAEQPETLLVDRPAAAVASTPRLVCLAGTVRNAAGQPCPGVCVFSTADCRQIAVTNAEGDFQLRVPANTALSLQADYFGLGSSRVAIEGHSAQPVRIVLGR